MLVLLLSLVTIVCAFECVRALADLRNGFIRLIVFSALGVVHGLAPALRHALAITAPYAGEAPMNAAGLALAGVILLSLGWRTYDAFHPGPGRRSLGLQAALETEEARRLFRRLFWFTFIIGIIGWLGDMLSRGVPLSQMFSAPRFTGRLTTGYLSLVFAYPMTLLVVPGFLGFLINRRHRIAGIVIAAVMGVLVYLTSGGTRGLTMGIFGAAVVGYLTYRRISVKRFLFIGALATVLVLLSASLYELRKQMRRMSGGEMVQFVFSREPYQQILNRDPLDYHKFLVGVVYCFPDSSPYVNGATYRRIFFFFLPQRWFPQIKPVDTSIIIGAALVPERAHLLAMIPPTMMGDLYVNFWGWPGIAGMFFWGMLLGFVNYKFQRSFLWHIYMGSSFVYLWIFLGRGAPHLTFLKGGFILVFLWIFGRTIGQVSFGQINRFSEYVEQDAQDQAWLAASP